MIYEIRDYHYRRDLFEDYKKWAEEAVPVLKDKLDLVGFWVDSGIEADLRGTDPMDSPIGHANVTWIIRWESKEARDELFPKAMGSDEWQAVWAKHPDPNGYVQTLSRFFTEM
jgi:hypothetical protein